MYDKKALHPSIPDSSFSPPSSHKKRVGCPALFLCLEILLIFWIPVLTVSLFNWFYFTNFQLERMLKLETAAQLTHEEKRLPEEYSEQLSYEIGFFHLV
jgi:hypothetical protein